MVLISNSSLESTFFNRDEVTKDPFWTCSRVNSGCICVTDLFSFVLDGLGFCWSEGGFDICLAISSEKPEDATSLLNSEDLMVWL